MNDNPPNLTPERQATLVKAVGALLAELDAEIAAHTPPPVCKASGRCCHFEEYGHRLYVTMVELHYFAATAPPLNPAFKIQDGQSPPGCPYQIANLCTARAARPMGCRIYFCDPQAQSWQNSVYEKYHAQLRSLHEKFGVEYEYLEWRMALQLSVPRDP